MMRVLHYGKKIWLLCLILFFSLTTISCLITFKTKPNINENIFKKYPPKSIAILPFENKTKDVELENQTREAIFAAMASKEYQEIELSELDEILSHIATEEQKSPRSLPPETMKKYIKSDLFLWGSVEQIKSFYLLFYSHLKIKMNVNLYDTRYNKIIFTNEATIYNRRFSLPTSILGILQSCIETFWHLRRVEKYDTLLRLSQKILAPIPKYISSSDDLQGRIREVKVYFPGKIILSKLLTVGDAVVVDIKAAPGKKVTFDVGKISQNIPTKEIALGHYQGQYTVQYGDNSPYCLIRAHILENGKEIASHFNSTTDFTVDTNSPKTPELLSIKSTKKSLLITFKNNLEEDFDSYTFFRSNDPIKNYDIIGESKEPLLKDKKIEHDTTYYYFATAVDKLGNLSQPSKRIKIHIYGKSPVIIDSNISEDSIFLFYSSPYIIRQPVIINSGVTLQIEEGVKIIFEDDGNLVIRGKLEVLGDKRFPVIFEGKKDNWNGLIFKSPSTSGEFSKLNFANFKSADCAVLIEQGEVSFTNCLFEKCGIGIKSLPGTYLHLNKCGFQKNEKGIVSQSKHLSIKECDFMNNTVHLQTLQRSDILEGEDKIIKFNFEVND